jgi:plastocyanin
MSTAGRFVTPLLFTVVLATLGFMTGKLIAADAQAAAVTAKDSKFDPATLEIKVGTKVTWTNKDGRDHNIRSGTVDKPKDGPVKGELPSDGGTFSYTFDKAGEYEYYCGRHVGMSGKIVVK